MSAVVFETITVANSAIGFTAANLAAASNRKGISKAFLSNATAQEFRDTIAASPWTWTPDATYATSGVATRIYGATAVDNNKLLPSSPAINAGVNICTGTNAPLTGCTGSGTGTYTDYDGKMVPKGSAPDIGAYEYQGKSFVPKMPNMFRRLKISDLDIPEIQIKPLSLIYAGI